MNLFVTGTPRSGSTMLASMLNNPPRNPVFNEPGIRGGSIDARTRRHLNLVLPHEDVTTWKNVASRLEEEGISWGIKEVRSWLIPWVMHKMKPTSTVVIVRDIRDSALSYRERVMRAGLGKEKARTRMKWIVESAAQVMWLVDHTDPFVVHYEQIVDPEDETLDDLSEWLLGWSLKGDMRYFYDSDKRTGGRSYEADRHHGRPGGGSVARWRCESDGAALDMATKTAERCIDYQRRFGYA